MFTKTMFNKGDQTTFVYPDSKTNVPTTRNGIVDKVGETYIILKFIDTQTQEDKYKSFSFNKMQKLG